MLLQPDFVFGVAASWSRVETRPAAVVIGTGKVLLLSSIMSPACGAAVRR
jgi:hypothetical protein